MNSEDKIREAEFYANKRLEEAEFYAKRRIEDAARAARSSERSTSPSIKMSDGAAWFLAILGIVACIFILFG